MKDLSTYKHPKANAPNFWATVPLNHKYYDFKITFQIRVDGVCQNKIHPYIAKGISNSKRAISRLHGTFCRDLIKHNRQIKAIMSQYPKNAKLEIGRIVNVEIIRSYTKEQGMKEAEEWYIKKFGRYIKRKTNP